MYDELAINLVMSLTMQVRVHICAPLMEVIYVYCSVQMKWKRAASDNAMIVRCVTVERTTGKFFLLKQILITDHCKKAMQTYHILQELLEAIQFSFQTCPTEQKQIL
jgi:hypothetical protein